MRLSRRNREQYESSLEILFEENYERIYRFSMSLTSDPELAEEVTQEAFYKAFLKLETLKDKGKFYSWVCSIAINEYKDMLRKRIERRNRNITIYNQNGELQDDNIPELRETKDPERIYEDREAIHEVVKCVEELSIEEQQIINLKYYHGLTYAEIEEILGIKADNAKVKSFRAKKKVMERLQSIKSKEVHKS